MTTDRVTCQAADGTTVAGAVPDSVSRFVRRQTVDSRGPTSHSAIRTIAVGRAAPLMWLVMLKLLTAGSSPWVSANANTTSGI
jgi:hypothetical protein